MRKIRITIIISMLLVILLNGCSGKEGVYAVNNNGYRLMNGVEGVDFEIPEQLLESAAAITQISQDMEYDADSPYVYKNGSDQFLYFEMSTLVVAVQKGTDFEMPEKKDMKEYVKSGNIMGIFFDSADKKLSYVSEKNKLIADVTAQVSVTADLFDDYTGKLAIINDNDSQWAMFVGVPSTKYDNLKKSAKSLITTMAKSLVETDDVNTKSETENVVVVGGQKEEIEPSMNIETTSSEETEKSVTSKAEIESEELSEETETKSFEESITKAESVESETTNTVPEKKTIEVTEPKVQTDNKAKNKKETGVVVKSNQKEYNRNKETPYMAGIYDMLPVGYLGNATVVTKNGIEYVQVRIEQLYTDKEAEKIIKDYCNSEAALYKYEEAPTGCSWQVVKYSLDYKDASDKPYLNIKIRGMDGDSLKFRGIKYSKKTKDIFYKSEESGTKITDMYCYYAVPNGCPEYTLECGDGSLQTESNGLAGTYFKIQVP